TVAGFTIVVSVLVGLAAGLLPAFQAGGSDLHSALQDSSGRSGGGHARRRVRAGLVIGEVALAMTLLVGAGLLMRSFQYLSGFHPGFDPSGVLSLNVALPQPPPALPAPSPQPGPQVQSTSPGAAPAQGQAPAEPRAIVSGRQILQRIR